MIARVERVAIDANVLIYAAAGAVGQKHRLAQKIMDGFGGTGAILALQTLAEFYWAVTRKAKLAAPQASSFVDDWMKVYDVVAADRETLTTAIDAVATHRLSFWDAMMWATVRQAGATVLLTEDMQDGATIGGVTFRNPFAGRSMPADVAALLR